MSQNAKGRYSIYPKKKRGKLVRSKEEKFLKRSFEWLNWKVIQIGKVSFYKPCLE